MEITTIKTLPNLITETSWVLFDLDNTVFESKQALAHADWIMDLLTTHMRETGLNIRDASDDLYPRWLNTLSAGEVQPVETESVATIKALQQRGIVTMGLTARRPITAEITQRQLASIHVDFTKTPPHQNTFCTHTENPIDYHEGVLFAGDYTTKGQTFLWFLQEIKQTPSSVILVDDSLHNVTEFENTLSQSGIPCKGLHYTAIHHKPKIYCPEIAHIQLNIFEKTNHIISNEEALRIKEKNSCFAHEK